MSVTVRIPGPLRRITNGQAQVDIECSNIMDCITSLESQFPGIQERMLDEAGELRYFVNVYINGEDIRFLEGVKTPTNAGDEISIVPAVAGGEDPWRVIDRESRAR